MDPSERTCHHLTEALVHADDETARYHIRQALQLAEVVKTSDDGSDAA